MSANDTSIVKLVVVGLIALGLIALVGPIFLIAIDKPVPDALWPLAGAAPAALGALLASTRSVDVAGLQALANARENDPPPSEPPPSRSELTEAIQAWEAGTTADRSVTKAIREAVVELDTSEISGGIDGLDDLLPGR